MTPSKIGSSDRRIHLTFKDKKIEREYKQILQKIRVLSFLSFLVLFAALDAIFTDIIILVPIIPASYTQASKTTTVYLPS